MKKALSILIFALVANLCPAQISDEEAILQAKKYISAWSPEFLAERPTVLRDTMAVRGRTIEYFHVQFGEAVAWLKSDGTFTGFANMGSAASNARGPGSDIFGADEEVWARLLEITAEIELPEGLERSKLEREDREGLPFCFRLTMRPSPFGYVDSDGNYLVAELHRTTGQLLGLSVARGWTYEPPNIRMSESQAIARGVDAFGGDPAEWRAQLVYKSLAYERAPSYFKPMITRQKMRLMYIVSSDRGTVMIDTVTTSVLDSWKIDADGGSGKNSSVSPTGSAAGVAQGLKSGDSRDPLASAGPTSRVLSLAIGTGALLIAAGAVVFIRRAVAPR